MDKPEGDAIQLGDKVFVYGTLRMGEGNHRLMVGRAKFLTETTMPGLKMYNLGYCPGVKEEGNGKIVGELFEVTDETLPASLDRLEGYPRLYDRKKIMTEAGFEAWVYIFNHDLSGESAIKTGDWKRRAA